MTITPTAHLNAKVASWTKNIQSSLLSLPSSIFKDNMGEDGLSSQSTYGVDIGHKD
jgi:hypothetical protein